MERVYTSEILLCIILLLMVFSAVVYTALDAVVVYAEEVSFEERNVLEDLKTSTIDGKAFNVKDYPYKSGDSARIINFVEYCYSFKANMNSNYSLYVYVYNPSGNCIDVSTSQNKIQIAVEFDSDGKATKYEKFNLKYCCMTEGDYKYLFYKFKVEDRKLSDGSTFYTRVNSIERDYYISGFELLTKGDRNATEYTVGGEFSFSGYSKGYGPDSEAESTLTCDCKKLETISLDVKHTYYRTNSSSLGAGHYNEVNTVYFAVSDDVLNNYGNLQKIRAEWWEYKTKKALVTSNSDLYNEILKNVTKNVGKYSSDVKAELYTGYYTITSGTGMAGVYLKTPVYEWTYNMPDAENQVEKSYSSVMPYAFYSEKANSVSNVFDFLTNSQNVGNVESNVMIDWIYNYSNELGNGYIDCNGRSLSKDLFEDSVDSGRTMGYNDKTIDLEDTFDLKSYDSNHSWWDKLSDYGFSWTETSGDYSNVSPIYELKASDLVGTDSEIAKKLLVNEEDVSELRAYYAEQSLLNKQVFLFRFASTDYYSVNAGGKLNGTDILESTNTAYIAQETLFMDFDIIELTFNKDEEYTVIPVVSSPVDIINGLTAPSEELEWWKILLAVVMLLVFIAIFAPLMPLIVRGVAVIISIPFRLIAAIIKAISKSRNKKDK